MNKILFNEGGQPLYLDDLRLLQNNPVDQMRMFLQVIGGGKSVYLLDRMQIDSLEADTTADMTTVQTKRNWLVEDGVIYEIEPATQNVHSWDTPMYVGVKRTSSDMRIFEDGQEHACRETAKAYLTLEKTDGVYDISKLQTLFELLAPLVASKIPVNEYRDIPVEFRNGYTGQVQYKEEVDCYRIRMRLKSNIYSWTEESGVVFTFGERTPSWLNENVSAGFVVGGDTSARAQEERIIIKDKTASLTGNLDLEDSMNDPASCPVDTIFFIPK